jgi:beta-glucosidase
MKKTICFILTMVLTVTFTVQSFARTMDVNELVSKMSLEEKAKLVVGVRTRSPGAPSTSGPAVGRTEMKVPGAAGNTFAIPGMNIPSMVLADGPAGLRISPTRRGDNTNTYYATAFPIATLLASTWDTDLVEKAGSVIGNEVLEYGVDIILMPALNLHRNPLCGRNFEYYSEDPLVSGSMAAAMVKGIQSNNVGTSLKHFVANNQETNRHNIDTIVSERALRELYLKGFEIAVKKSAPWTVMSSYNKINGSYASESFDLLTKILRDDWGFEGFVMTDWGAGKDPVAQMKAGNDLLMPGKPEQSQKIIEAINSGQLDINILDKNVKRILNIISLSPAYRNYKYSDKPDLAAHAQVARAVATEGMILLKNQNNALPLKGVKKIELFGNTSYELIVGGTGSGDVHEAYSISIEEGLKNADYTLDDSLKEMYLSFIKEKKDNQPKRRSPFAPKPPIPEMPVSSDVVEKMADDGDLAIITIGRNSGEFADRKIEGDFNLSSVEKELIQTVSNVFHAKQKKVIIVLNIGGVIETASWRDYPDAILLAWQPGQEGGNAIADVLTGKVNPSGKLASTFPMDYNDTPSAKNFPGTPPDKPEKVIYEEGIYVGYRYYNTFDVKTAYEFGYGLSYTDFGYGDVNLSSSVFKDKLTATIKITNSGKAAGREIVQLYISAPGKTLDKPQSELRAFAKTKLLQPGESQTLRFDINPADLASFDTQRSSWVAEQGKYIVKIGSSSKNIKQTASFELPEEFVVENLNKALSPQVEINELKK